MEHQNNPDLRRLRAWCRECDVPVSTLYARMKDLNIKPIKIGKGSYLNREQRQIIISGGAAA